MRRVLGRGSACVAVAASWALGCTLLNEREDYYDARAPFDAGGTETPTDAASDADDTEKTGTCPFTVDVYEAVNPTTENVFYSLSAQEIDEASATGFTDKRGVAFRVTATPGSRRSTLYQLFKQNNGDRLLTLSKTEARGAGYVEEQTLLYAATSQTPCTVPVYALSRSGLHRVSSRPSERDALLADGWKDDAIRFYAGVPPGP